LTDLFVWAEKHARQVAAPPMQRPGNVPADALPTDVQRVRDLLATHCGKDQAITALQVAKTLDLLTDSPNSTRNAYVRRIIRIHRADFPFCVISSNTGYFRPAVPEELNHYERDMLSRIREIGIGLSVAKKQARCDGWIRRARADWQKPP
jgi:hypothetical protein